MSYQAISTTQINTIKKCLVNLATDRQILVYYPDFFLLAECERKQKIINIINDVCAVHIAYLYLNDEKKS